MSTPLVVELFSGDRIPINHPEAIRLEDGLIRFNSPKGRHRLLECSSVCQVLDDV